MPDNANAVRVGGVAFDISLNTAALNNAVNAAAQQINAQLTGAFRSTMTACENSISQIGRSINNISGEMRGSFENAANDIRSSMSQTAQSVTEAVRSSSQAVAQQLENNSRSLSENMRNASNDVAGVDRQSQAAAGTIGGTFTGAVKKLGSAIAAAFALKQIISFTRSCVEAAAQVKALNAQLEQTFNVLETDARNAIKAVADESGILETRLQGVGTQIYAFAKTSGMDSVSALNMMQEALKVTADSAAYYDRSIEDVSESLKSFLKGNYANDAALGISCTETTRNAAANKLYGKSFMELSEAQKQLTLLQMVKDANELSGAVGQAARESDGWENVIGNLREAWKQLSAALGTPILQALIPVVKNITDSISKMTESVKEATAALAELFGWDLSSAEGTGNSIMNIADDVSQSEENAGDEIEKTAKKQEKVQKSLAGFDKLNVLSQKNNEDDEGADEAKNEKIAQTAELAQKSVDELNEKVNSVKFDGIKKAVGELMSFIQPLADAVRGNVHSTVDIAQQGIQKYLGNYGGEIGEYADRIKTNLIETAAQTRNGIANIINEATESQSRMSESLSTGFADLLGGASIFTLSFADVFSDMFSTISGSFEQWTIDNSSLIGDFFDGINGNFANIMTTLGNILNDAGTMLTEWWDNTGSQAFSKLTEAFFDVQTVLLDFWTSYVSPFIDYIIDSVGDLWDNHLSKLWSGFLEFISSLWEAIAAIWDGLLRPIYDTFIKRLMVGVMGALKSIWDIVVDVFGVVVDIIRGVIRSAQGLLDFITGIFTGDMEKAVKGFAEFVQGIAIMIWGVIKGALNLIIDALNTVWSALYGVLKSIVDGISDFVGAIGDVFGADWGFSMPDEVPRIPRLATGGIVRAPTIAMVGDNPNAYRDPEIVSPLSKLNSMMDEKNALSDELLTQILSYLKMIHDICKEDKLIEVIAELDGDPVFKNIVRRNNAYKRMHGGRSAFA